jgi:hypothetical protein
VETHRSRPAANARAARELTPQPAHRAFPCTSKQLGCWRSFRDSHAWRGSRIFSGIGADAALASRYSRGRGEGAVRSAFPTATIITSTQDHHNVHSGSARHGGSLALAERTPDGVDRPSRTRTWDPSERLISACEQISSSISATSISVVDSHCNVLGVSPGQMRHVEPSLSSTI